MLDDVMYSAALIGCGNIGSLYAEDPKIKGIYTHAAAYDRCLKTKLIAVCDADIQKAKKVASQWNCAFYSDYAQLLAEQEPDIVSICTPDETHATILKEVLDSHKKVSAVIIEKPLALDHFQANQLIELANLRGIILAVNYSRRYSTQLLQVKKMIALGNLGKIQKISGYYTKGILHNGTHWLDLSTWFLGEIKSVQGFLDVKNEAVDPALDAQLVYNNGTRGVLQALEADHYSLFEMDILGTQGRIRIIDSGHRIEFYEVKDNPYYTGYKTVLKANEDESDMHNTVLNIVTDLVNCMETGNIPKCSGEDGLRVLNIGIKLIESARQGSKIIQIEEHDA